MMLKLVVAYFLYGMKSLLDDFSITGWLVVSIRTKEHTTTTTSA